jgi:hypothetical protein
MQKKVIFGLVFAFLLISSAAPAPGAIRFAENRYGRRLPAKQFIFLHQHRYQRISRPHCHHIFRHDALFRHPLDDFARKPRAFGKSQKCFGSGCYWFDHYHYVLRHRHFCLGPFYQVSGRYGPGLTKAGFCTIVYILLSSHYGGKEPDCRETYSWPARKNKTYVGQKEKAVGN